AKTAPGLGSMLLFGLGGIFVEVMQDVVVAVAPLSRPEALEMMQGIKGYPLLTGVRGEVSADLEAVADLLLRASRLAADFPAITEMDLNPIFVYEQGTIPAVVDVRIKVQ
ncbi:MAG: acetate--CoA ligase family protein, partial [bacterium]